MAGNINFSNHQWLVKSFDANNNGVMEELQLDDRVAEKVDTDRNGQVSREELTAALRSDAVEIKQGRITENRGNQIFVHGLETLKNVHATATASWGHVFAPSFFQDDTPGQRYSKLVDSNRAYGSAVTSQESALRSIRDMTANATDATSKALHIQANTSLNAATWRTWMSVIQQFGDNGSPSEGNISQMQQANSNMQAAYETLNATLRAIAEQTQDLPDVQGAIKATDGSISHAFANVQAIKHDSQSRGDVSTKLNRIADEKQAQATGRTGPWGGVGAGIGAVAGAAIGYFAGGQNVKNAMIGAGVGLAVGGGGGALAGHMKDQAFLGEAKSLRALAGDVTRYNPDAAESQLVKETQSMYNEVLKARETHDLDNARVNTNSLNTIQGRVKPVEQESTRILDAYRMK
ncbi:MAG TPA: hypothetical protein V6D23_26195 [Candidatus Obscuribacterales bacterium]